MEDPKNTAQGQAATDPNAQAAGAQPAANTAGQTAEGQKMVPLPALHEAREEVKALRAEMETLKQTYGQTQVNSAPTYQAPPQNNMAAQLENLWEEDPRRAMQTEVMMALNWYDSTNAELDNQESQASSKHDDFDKYRNEVRSFLRRLPVTERNKPGVVELAYYQVKGQKADQMLSSREQEIIRKIRAGESIQGLEGTVTASIQQQPVKATVDQEKAALAMGIPVEEYMKHVKR